ncbi:MAG: outer membrane beta-barrel protein [Candidatus Korobacteraceae bacterium]|jgi:putative OmpL-like beta-barrel porin-2
MTYLFLITCVASVVFFLIFLLQCSVATRKSTRFHQQSNPNLALRRVAESQAIDAACGRRFFVHLEEQMSEFLSAHGRTAAMLVLVVLLPLAARAQAQSGPSPDQQAGAADQQIPPAVQKQLEAMQKRIDQLEQELNARAPDGAALSSKASAPVHVVGEQAAPAAEGALAQQAAPANEKPAPFSFADFSWLNGNSRIKEVPFDTKFFTPEIRSDVDYVYDFRHPQDDTISGSSEIFRSSEVQLTQLGVGGDFHWDNVQARLMTQIGLYSQTTPRNDASPARGQWDLADAYRYISEAWGGYHWNVWDGVNVQAGIFLSYIGLFSYYQFDNWAYQPSYVSSNTPWFFNGMRVQIFPNQHLKIEPWLINGWQSYGRFNQRPGVGGQILWRPTGWFSFVGNQYALGADTLGIPGRVRYHTDDSIEIKYYDNPDRMLDKMALSFTGDLGCEHGGGVSCAGDSAKGPKQSFIGFMYYNRFWFHKDLYGLTIGGGEINNPGRYLVLLPPINGATAASGTPYFTENPGQPFKAWDASVTTDYMPSQYVTFRLEYNHRAANVPYFSGSGGVTPPGGNTGAPGSTVPGWAPDLVKSENRMTGALLVMF